MHSKHFPFRILQKLINLQKRTIICPIGRKVVRFLRNLRNLWLLWLLWLGSYDFRGRDWRRCQADECQIDNISEWFSLSNLRVVDLAMRPIALERYISFALLMVQTKRPSREFCVTLAVQSGNKLLLSKRSLKVHLLDELY